MAEGADTGATTTTSTTDTGGDRTFTQADVDRLMGERIAGVKAKYADYDDLRAAADELKTLKTASQSDLERLTGETNTLKGENGSLKSQNLRLKTALKLGFVEDRAELADLLQGSTEAEMEEHGKKLAVMFNGGSGGTGFDGGARGGGDKPQTMDQAIRRMAGRAG